MIELGIVVILVGFMAWREHGYRKETAKLVNALLSKNAAELRDLTLADKTEIKIKPNKKNDELVPLDQLNDEAWYKAEIENNV